MLRISKKYYGSEFFRSEAHFLPGHNGNCILISSECIDWNFIFIKLTFSFIRALHNLLFLLRFSDFCVCLYLRLCLDRRLEAGGGGRFLPHEAPPTGFRPREGPAAMGVPPLTPFYKNLIIGTSPRNTPSDPTDKPVLQSSLSILRTPKVFSWVPNQNICMCA